MSSYSLKNIDIDSELKQKLSDYIEKINKINAKFDLKVELSSIFLKTIESLKVDHIRGIVSDTGHGLEHAIEVIECALLLSREDREVDKESMAVACLLHDLFGIQIRLASGKDLFNRDIHPEEATTYVQKEFKKVLDSLGITYLNLNAIAIAILSHGDKVDTFLKRFKTRPENEFYVAKYLRDADRLVEGKNIKRILSVSEGFKKPLLKKSIVKPERIVFLFMENRNILESEHTDLLFFLSRNITINLNESNYITDEAKAIINHGSPEEILQNIIILLKDFPYDKYLGDAMNLTDGLKESKIILRDVSNAYFRLKQRGLLYNIQHYVLSMTSELNTNSYGKKKDEIISWIENKIKDV